MSTAAVMNYILEKFCDEDGNINVARDEQVKDFQSMKTTASRGSKLGPWTPRDTLSDTPKRPTSSYHRWLNENRKVISKACFPVNKAGMHCYPNDHENAGEALQGRAKVTEITRVAVAMWNTISQTLKQPYEDEFNEAQSAYQEGKDEYIPGLNPDDPRTLTKAKVKAERLLCMRVYLDGVLAKAKA